MKTEKKRRRLWVVSGLLLFMAVLLLTPWSRAGAVEPQVSAGALHTVGLKSDGTVVAVGDNTYGQIDVTGTGWTDIVAVSAGDYHNVGLKSDGTVVAVGYNAYGQRDVTGTGWTDIVAVSAGALHTAGLKSDGTVVAVGDNAYGQTDVTGTGWTDIVAVSAGETHTVGLKSDGTVVAVGANGSGQRDVTGTGWTDIVAVSASSYHTVGLKSDGTVVAVGFNNWGQMDIGSWTDIVAVSAGSYHTVGLKSDGTVVAVGDNTQGQMDVTGTGWTDIVAVSAGSYHTVGLKSDGTVVAAGWNVFGQTDIDSWSLGTLVRGAQGTEVFLRGSGFGSKKGKVLVGKVKPKIVFWSDSTIVFEMDKVLATGDYSVTVTAKGKGAMPMVYGKSFTMKAPEVRFVSPNQGVSGDAILLTGKYFGSVQGKIFLGKKPCTVLSWYMDADTGESLAVFAVPKKLTSGNYGLRLVNKTGTGRSAFVRQ